MNVHPTALPGVLLIEPHRYSDTRGYFFESWNAERYTEAGLSYTFVQDNISYSYKGALRGLHFQHPYAQGKLVSTLEGEIFDVVVDVRKNSPTFRQWIGIVLSRANGRQLYVPEGFAHGFVVLSEAALFHYKCTEYYKPDFEHTILWNDPDIGIDWPISAPVLSDKDARGIPLRDMIDTDLPSFNP